jgi:hypothetical protein
MFNNNLAAPIAFLASGSKTYIDTELIPPRKEQGTNPPVSAAACLTVGMISNTPAGDIGYVATKPLRPPPQKANCDDIMRTDQTGDVPLVLFLTIVTARTFLYSFVLVI